jgi:hypothetical protein
VLVILHLLRDRLATARLAAARRDDGFSTAELLANAAFAIVALFAIWQGLQAVGVDVVTQIGARLTGGL